MSRRVLALAGAAALVIACRSGTDVRPSLHLLVTPESLALHGRAGDSVLPDRYLTLSFAEKVQGPWAAFEDGAWFFLSADKGELPYFLTVAPRPAGLAAGIYAASIRIVAGNESVRIPVTLELAPVASVSGRWAGRADTLHISMELEQQGSTVTGSGTVGAPVGGVTITGTWTDPNLSLELDGASGTWRVVAVLANDNALSGTLAPSVAPGTPAVPLALYRQ